MSQSKPTRIVEIDVEGAAPNERLRIEFSSPVAGAGFAPPPCPAAPIAATLGEPGVEFVAVSADHVLIATDCGRGARGALAFRLRLGIEGLADGERFTLSAETAPGTAVRAVLPGELGRRLGVRPRAFAYDEQPRRSDFAGARAPAIQIG